MEKIKKPARCANTEQAKFQILQYYFNLFGAELIQLAYLLPVALMIILEVA